MRRKEMVQIMAEVYELCTDASPELSIEEKMEEVLIHLEICSMRPPCKAGFGGHGHLEMDGSCSDYIESCDFAWEHENA
jgi:hypothetical protein